MYTNVSVSVRIDLNTGVIKGNITVSHNLITDIALGTCIETQLFQSGTDRSFGSMQGY